MLAFYNISKKVRGELEKKLEDLSRESKWVSIRAISIAFMVLVMRELLVSSNTQSYEEIPLYVDALPYMLVLLIIIFLLSIKGVRRVLRANLYDYYELKFISDEEKRVRLAKEIKSVKLEIEYVYALSSLTTKRKTEKISFLIEENMREIYDKIEEIENSSYFITEKDNQEEKSAIANNRERFDELISILEENGVKFSAQFSARINMT